MSLTAMLDVAIGLVFLYLLLGIFAAALQEVVASRLTLRGKMLRDGVARLLPGIVPGAGSSLFDLVFNHGLIGGTSEKNLPSYIPARNFALALFESLKDGSQAPLFGQIASGIARLPNGSAKDSLMALLNQAGGDLDTLRKSVETWFDDAMDRVSGEYKRFAQNFTLIFGFVVAVTCNVDTISVARTLWTDTAARNAIVAMAQTFANEHRNDSALNGKAPPPPGENAQGAAPGAGGGVDAPVASKPDENAAKPEEKPKTPEQAQIDAQAVKKAIDALPLPLGWARVTERVHQREMEAWKKAEAEKKVQAEKEGAAKKDEAAEKSAGPPAPPSLLHVMDVTVFAKDGSGIALVFGWFITALAVSLGAPFWFHTLQQLLSLRGSGPKPARSGEAEGAAS